MDAGFLSVVENGQYFMTKDTRYLTQFNTVACREHTLPREESTSQPIGWIQGNTKIGPVLEVTTSYLHGKHGVEIRIMSLSRDDTHSWAAKHSLSEYEVSKKVIHLLRHSQKVHREEDGAVHFWRMKENLQNPFPQSIHWSDSRWKACLAAGGGAKRRFQYCTDDSGTIVYFRALRGHSGRNLIDPSLQDNVVIQSRFFQYIYHIGCAFNLHSIINSGFIPGGQNSSKRQTVFFLLVDPGDKKSQGS